MKLITTFTLAATMIVGVAFAQSKPVPTHVPAGAGAKASNLRTVNPQGANLQAPNMHAIGLRMRDQKRQLAKAMRSGKLSKEQAKAVFQKLKEARKKELDFFHQNNSKEISADQKAQLDKMLDENASSL